jgi:hypothetical protein
MLRQSVLGLGVVAAVFVSAASAGARDRGINLHCSVEVSPARPADPPRYIAIAMNYRIDLGASAVNGEIVRIDRSDVNGPKLTWNRPANASVPASHYVLDLGTGRLFVSFDKFEYDGRKFAGAARRLRCTDRLLKIAA